MIISPQVWQYELIAIGAFLVGLGKGGLPGVGNLTVVIMALVLPAKASVGILLPILISADIIAIIVYHRHAQWRYIRKLAPWIILGILFGFFVFGRVDNDQVRILIGLILLCMAAAHFYKKWLDRGPSVTSALHQHPAFVGTTGVIGGFATMVANAAGPVAALYFISSGLPKYAYIGTSAWFFFLVNLFKVPFMLNLQIIDWASIRYSASFMIYAVLGALIAPIIVKYINQRVFNFIVWFFVIVGGIRLIIPYSYGQ